MADIAQEFQGNYRKFEATAREWTEKYAGQVSLDFIQIQTDDWCLIFVRSKFIQYLPSVSNSFKIWHKEIKYLLTD